MAEILLAPGSVAGARHFRELVAWQLADDLRVLVLRFSSRVGLAQDRRLRRQIEDAADSVCRNIAEGFGCESHREFARFLGISRRSLNEVQDALRSAELKGYVTSTDLDDVQTLLRRLHPALGRLIAYLQRTATPGTDVRSHGRPKGSSR